MKVFQGRKIRGKRILALGIFVFAVTVSSLIVYSGFRRSEAKAPEISLYSCANDEQKFRCYGSYFATLTNYQNPGAAYKILRAKFPDDPYLQGQCHEMSHIIGRTAYLKYNDLAIAFTKGDNFCWSGYYHGVTEQAISTLGAAKIKQQASTICSTLKQAKIHSFDHFNCVHGLGHGFMAIDNYEVFNALKTCDLLSDDWDQSSCYGGVFMENVMVAVRGNGQSKYLRPSDLLYPCNAVEYKYKASCYLGQTSYMLKQNNYDFAGAFELCKQAEDDSLRTSCYQSVGRDASGITSSNVELTVANCAAAPDQNTSTNCMIGAVKDFVAYYHDDAKAHELCAALGETLHSQCDEVAKSYFASF